MAADPTELAALTKKLRGKGLSDEQVVESLRGLGFSKAQAAEAAGVGKTPPPPARKARSGSAPPAAGPAPVPTGSPAPQLGVPDLSGLTLTPPKKLRAGDLGGFAAGLVLYVLALNYLRFGGVGVSGWLRAKFLNQPADLGTKKKTNPGGRAGGAKKSNTDNGLTSTKAAVNA
ncbi:MAG: hypothetical protein QM714_12540 [Nocardioides sp.]|uniref:hypothetical protein n=1 Tax=Nocardioides sp. TaxID=35761 RepID=UPI0039E4F87B